MILRRIRRYGEMTAAERRLVLRALIALSRVEIALRFRGLDRVLRDAPSVLQSTPPGAGDWQRAYQYARSIGTASRFHIIRARCLHRSLVLHQWLRQEGLPSEVRIGVRKVASELKAHAWVEMAGQVVNDRPAAVADFLPLLSAKVQRSVLHALAHEAEPELPDSPRHGSAPIAPTLAVPCAAPGA